jgi:hypothetical protein
MIYVVCLIEYFEFLVDPMRVVQEISHIKNANWPNVQCPNEGMPNDSKGARAGYEALLRRSAHEPQAVRGLSPDPPTAKCN